MSMKPASVWRSKKVRRDTAVALLFILPWILGFLAFNLYPMAASFYYSFTDKSIKSVEWVGLENFVKLFSNDRSYFKSLSNTVYMVVIGVPATIIFSFLVALLLNAEVKGMSVYRTIYYLPTVVPPVAGTLLWMWLLNPQRGVLNALIESFGLRSPGWFSDPQWSKPSLILMGVWASGQSTVLYLAGLQGIPTELYEAARLDGANWLQRTLRITIPMISPVTLFILITGVIGTFQLFTQAFLIGGTGRGTDGWPRQSLLFYAVYLYRQAFEYLDFGYASAMAWILFIIILGVTILLIRGSAHWVHYEA
jgi:multiple sugar transport system permease protein